MQFIDLQYQQKRIRGKIMENISRDLCITHKSLGGDLELKKPIRS